MGTHAEDLSKGLRTVLDSLILACVITWVYVLASLLEAERYMGQTQVTPVLQVGAILNQPTTNKSRSQNQQN